MHKTNGNPSRMGRRARDQGPRSSFRQEGVVRKFATVSFISYCINKWRSMLRPLRIWGGKWGQHRLLLL